MKKIRINMWCLFILTYAFIAKLIHESHSQAMLNSTNWPKRKPMKIRNASRVPASPITPTYYHPNPGYDAYWTDGHWIFGTTTTKASWTTTTRTRIMVCRKPCPIEYRNVGKVCGHYVEWIDSSYTASNAGNNWPRATDGAWGHFTTFATYCEFLHLQCSRKIWNNMSMVFLHFGHCIWDRYATLAMEYDTDVILRKRTSILEYKKRFKDQHSNPDWNDRCNAVMEPNATRDWVDRIDLVGSCYRLITNATFYHWDARKECTKMGSNLFVLDNEVEHEVVTELITEVSWLHATFYTDYKRQKWTYMFFTSESMHEVGYQPWADNRQFLYTGYMSPVGLRVSDSRYVEMYDSYASYWANGMALCEKQIAPRPPFRKK